VREPADVVEDDLAVRAEHLGKATDDGQQRLDAGVEREQADPPSFVADGSQR
jgi:hypothetical protein